MPNFDRPEGLVFLRNPQARRSGIVGALGFEFDWTRANFELGGVAFTNVAATSSDSSVATVTLGDDGIPGQYAVSIDHLAKGQVTKSMNGFSATSNTAAPRRER